MLAKVYRLNKKNDFKNIYKKGFSFSSNLFNLKKIANRENINRFGIVVSLKNAKNATQRNKLRRQINEIIRENLQQIKTGHDLLIISKKSTKQYGFIEIKENLLALFKKAKIY
jgi:ribonuclease P protein component